MISPRLEEIPKLSSFVARTLMSMAPMGSNSEQLDIWHKLCASPWTRSRMEAVLAEPGASSTPEALAALLRRMRRDIVAGLVGRNSSGLCSYDEVVQTMSDFAELAVSRTVAVHARVLAEKHGVPLAPIQASRKIFLWLAWAS